jgi:type VI secretion system protein ImpL
MNNLKRFFSSPWTIGIFLLCVFAIFIFIIGPLISIGSWTPLEDTANQWLTIIAVAAFWLIKYLVSIILENKKEKGMVEAIVEDNSDDDINKEELTVLQARFSEAMTLLNTGSSFFKRKLNLYSLPWYIIIGPPGSGKTTALINSGLKFPLTESTGKQSLEGIGGTRNCDWWFTDQAIMIDTAGRYVTQDSNQSTDSKGWLNFLALLKKYRKRQPINGAFVTISASDLLLQTPHQRQQHINAIKLRIQELHTQLGISFPVYVMITKSDLINGFSDFFANLDQEDRKQVWGTTFDLQDATHPCHVFDEDFDGLVKRIQEQTINRVNSEKSVDRSAAIIGFSKQLQLLKTELSSFLSDIFENTQYEKDAMLRGVYFTSGTQEGMPIDRLVNQLAYNQQQNVNQATGKSFFISDLLIKVAFAESSLAGIDLKLEQRLNWIRRFSATGIAISTLAICLTWTGGYLYSQEYITDVESNIDQSIVQAQQISRYESSPISVLKVLNSLKRAAFPLDELLLEDVRQEQAQEFISPWYNSFGLSQQDKLVEQANNSYTRTLKSAFYSRLILELENILTKGQLPLSLKYITLRTYLMLGSEEHYQANEVIAFFTEVWLKSQSASLTQAQQSQLFEHIHTLFAKRPLPMPLALDARLINETRASLQSISFDEQIYARIKQKNFSSQDGLPAIKGFSLFNGAGKSLSELVFIRKSGRSLSEGLSPLYTKAVYTLLIAGGINEVADSVLGEAWVYGEDHPAIQHMNRDAIIEQVKTRYLYDYRKQYRELLADIDIMPFTSFEEARRVLDVLTSPASPFVMLLTSITKQTQLTKPNNLLKKTGESGALQQAQESLAQLLGNSAINSIDQLSSQRKDIVTEEFSEIHALVDNDGEAQAQGSAVIITSLEELKKIITAIAFENIAGAVPPALAEKVSTAATSIHYLSQNQSDLYVKPVLQNIINRSVSLSQSGVITHLNQLWKDEVLSFCKAAIEERYPLMQASNSDIILDDFSRFFGYTGMMDTFFNSHLRKYVDISKSPWKVRSSKMAPIVISQSALNTFEMADQIKRGFFQHGSAEAGIDYALRPNSMSAAISQANFNINGQKEQYSHGPSITRKMTWPGPEANYGVKITTLHTDGSSSRITESGVWAWMKVLNKVSLQPTLKPEKYNLMLNSNGYEVRYDLVAGTSNNPFALLKQLKFSCPTRI